MLTKDIRPSGGGGGDARGDQSQQLRAKRVLALLLALWQVYTTLAELVEGLKK